MESLLGLLALIFLFSFLGQWLSWGLRVPSIVFLFAAGLLAGPVSGLLSPDQMFGDLLFPIVSILIGIILFEGGLTLEFDKIRHFKGPILRIIFLGGAITFLLSSLSAFLIFEYSLEWSMLIGGILIVTGPTVVLPLLHQIRPEGQVGSIAQWEGIIIDPIGAIVAVIVFELILAERMGGVYGFGLGALKFLEAMSLGTAVGIFVAHGITVLFQRYWIPDYLHNLTILAGIIGAQAFCNHFVHESGLLAVTVMGMYMANQNRVSVRHILHFKEELRILFISILFILLVARLEPSFVYQIKMEQMLFLAALILIVRPAAVLLSTIGTNITWPERGFLAWIAPRGIVAAAVASLFSHELERIGMEGAAQLGNVTFFVIAGTVVIYGLTLPSLSRWLGVADEEPQGVLLIGAHVWGRALARTFQNAGVLVRLLDKNPAHVRRAHVDGLEAQCIDVLDESQFQTVNVQGIGSVAAITPNDEVNTLSSVHALDMGFERSGVFQLKPSGGNEEENKTDPFHGRFLFLKELDYMDIQQRWKDSWTFDSRSISSEEELESIRSRTGDDLFLVASIDKDQHVTLFSSETNSAPSVGDLLITFQKEEPGSASAGHSEKTDSTPPADDAESSSVS